MEPFFFFKGNQHAKHEKVCNTHNTLLACGHAFVVAVYPSVNDIHDIVFLAISAPRNVIWSSPKLVCGELETSSISCKKFGRQPAWWLHSAGKKKYMTIWWW